MYEVIVSGIIEEEVAAALSAHLVKDLPQSMNVKVREVPNALDQIRDQLEHEDDPFAMGSYSEEEKNKESFSYDYPTFPKTGAEIEQRDEAIAEARRSNWSSNS